MNTEDLLSRDEVIDWLQDQLCMMKQALELDHKFKANTTDASENWDRNIEEHEDAIQMLRSNLHHLGAKDDNRPFNPILA
jgi:hypothetical protein